MARKKKNDVPSGFVQMIQERMDEEGISLRQLAREVSMEPATLSRILTGQQGLPPNDSIMQLAEALYIEPPEMLLVEAGRFPLDKPKMVKLLRAVSQLTASDLDRVNKVAAAVAEKRRRRRESN